MSARQKKYAYVLVLDARSFNFLAFAVFKCIQAFLPSSTYQKKIHYMCINDSPLYIALDFDGVLHHDTAGPLLEDKYDPKKGVQSYRRMLEERIVGKDIDWGVPDGLLFDREHHLLELLKRLPKAQIVLATSWRNNIPYDDLISFLSPAVQDRVVGKLADSILERSNDGIRGDLMTDWLVAKKQADALWIALDDQAKHYQNHSVRLVKTNWRGMDEKAITAAFDKVEHLSGKS